jgi:hypothetical protein
MKYLGTAIKLALMIIGLTLISRSWEAMAFKSECLTGLAIFLTGLYFAIEGRYGDRFSGCLLWKVVKEMPKKKWFFNK